MRTLAQLTGAEVRDVLEELQDSHKKPPNCLKFRKIDKEREVQDHEPPQLMISTIIAEMTTFKGRKATNTYNSSNLRCIRRR